jgi:hypothetical protein
LLWCVNSGVDAKEVRYSVSIGVCTFVLGCVEVGEERIVHIECGIDRCIYGMCMVYVYLSMVYYRS